MDPGRPANFALAALETSELDKALLDETLRGAAAFMRRSAERLENPADRRRQGLLRRALDRQVMRTIMEGLTNLLKELQEESNPPQTKLLSTMRAPERLLLTREPPRECLAEAWSDACLS